MSNKDDFDFDDDPFRSDNDDELFGGRFNDEDDDFSDDFGDFDSFEDDADPDAGFDFGDEDIDLGTEDELEEPRRRSPIFLILALLLFLVLIGGIALLAFSLIGGGRDAELNVTRTAIAQINATTEALASATSLQATEFAFATGTALAASPTPTATATPEFELTLIAEAEATFMFETLIAEAEATTMFETLIAEADATIMFETQVAAAAEATRLAGIGLPTQSSETIVILATETLQAPSLGIVQMTATALAEIFSAQPTQDLATPIPLAGTPGTASLPSALPDTGLFDDLAGGNTGMIFLMAFGLLGVIAVSRRMRKRD